MRAHPPTSGRGDQALLLVWWIVWASLLAGLGLNYLFLAYGRPLPTTPSANPFVDLVGLVPLFVSIVIRWLVLPRYTDRTRAFGMYLVGLGLAEGCGILGIFLGGIYRDDVFALGVLGVLQFMPFFAKAYLQPKPPGFIPNN